LNLKVTSWFQAFAFECNLYRYSLALGATGDWEGAVEASRRALAGAGLAGVAAGGGADVPTVGAVQLLGLCSS
jgi:hypothetical protein